MIHVCRKSGDLSPLFPLSLKDVIWLEADERIERKERFEEKKKELEIQAIHVQAVVDILSDIRHIEIAQMPLSRNELMDFISHLPSFIKDAKKEQKETRWTVKQRKPGEVPEWKKKLQQKNNETCQKTG